MPKIVHGNPIQFEPPPFWPHRWLRGGHLQTLATVRSPPAVVPACERVPTRSQVIEVSDGDAIVLHEDCPASWQTGDPALLLVHGLSGCHAAPYMIRLAARLAAAGVRVYRMDMRGCGAAFELSANLTHAGRSDDIVAALSAIAHQTAAGPLFAAGVSLGGNQLLRAFGRFGGGLDPSPPWIDRMARIAAISPPVDLQRCSDQMQRWHMRPYNHFFIRALLSRVPPRVAQRSDYQQRIAQRQRLRTLRELDDQLTAPLSGFGDAVQYYAAASASAVAADLAVPTLVVAAADDPIIPIGCFTDSDIGWSPSTTVLVCPSGGHVGFIDRRRNCWMDEVLASWFNTSVVME